LETKYFRILQSSSRLFYLAEFLAGNIGGCLDIRGNHIMAGKYNSRLWRAGNILSRNRSGFRERMQGCGRQPPQWYTPAKKNPGSTLGNNCTLRTENSFVAFEYFQL